MQAGTAALLGAEPAAASAPVVGGVGAAGRALAGFVTGPPQEALPTHPQTGLPQVQQDLPNAPDLRYQRVAGLLQNDPAGTAALDRLRQSGQLDSQDAQGHTLLDNLSALSQQTLLPDLRQRRAELLSQTVQDVADPRNIFQGHRNTCGATSASITLARTRPAEYVRLLKDLSTPPGKAVLQDGKGVLEAKPDAFHEEKREFHVMGATLKNEGESLRTVTGRLLQPALMEYANGDADYNNQTEKHSGRGFPHNVFKVVPGLLPQEVERLNQGLFGGDYELIGHASLRSLVTDAQAQLRHRETGMRALEEGRVPAMAMINADQGKGGMPARGFHWLAIREIKDDGTGHKRVYFDDPNRLREDGMGPDGKPVLRFPDAGNTSTGYRPGDYRVDENGVASMPYDQFKEVVWSVIAPKP